MRARVVIVGGGFAGIFAMRSLVMSPKHPDVVLLDPRGRCDFLPLLPDAIGRGLAAAGLQHELAPECKRLGATYLRDAAVGVDLDTPAVETRRYGRLRADAVLLATGTQTNFRGNESVRRNAFKLDSVPDAAAIRHAAETGGHETLIVVGAGYTGIEIATHLRHLERLRGRKRRILLVEFADRILPRLKEPFAEYTRQNLKRMGVEVRTGDTVTAADGTRAVLESGTTFGNALVVWAAGVHTPAVIREIHAEGDQQGRLACEESLRVKDMVFAAGDVAGPRGGRDALRMAVQFSIVGGRAAAANILRALDGKQLKPFRPVNLGYVVPMANLRSCGTILGVDSYGLIPSAMHYIMSVFRTFGLKRALLVRDLLRRR